MSYARTVENYSTFSLTVKVCGSIPIFSHSRQFL